VVGMTNDKRSEDNTTNRTLCILTDYRGAFYSKISNRYGLCSLDPDKVKEEFQKRGWEVSIKSYTDVNFQDDNYKGIVVLYQSTEDGDLRYKSYQEDILLGILLQGGILVPPFRYFRAHHNKVFWEIIRQTSGLSLLKYPESRLYGTLEEFIKHENEYPIVLKASWGAGSEGVKLAKTRSEAIKSVKKISRSDKNKEIIKELIKRRLWKKRGYVNSSWHRNKFIVQQYVEGLSGDYKVLVYWGKFYVLRRDNRPKDFRASGSGRFYWPEDPPKEILDYAARIFTHFNVPMISLDIAETSGSPAVLEAQFVVFGPLTMEKSEWYFELHDGIWQKMISQSTPEIEFVRSISEYVDHVKPGWSI
jgi:hypothetical protein